MCCILDYAGFILTGSTFTFQLSLESSSLNEDLLEHFCQLLEKIILPGDLLVVALDIHAQVEHLLDNLMLSHS